MATITLEQLGNMGFSEQTKILTVAGVDAPGVDDKGFELNRDAFDKLGYNERLAIKRFAPEAYDALSFSAVRRAEQEAERERLLQNVGASEEINRQMHESYRARLARINERREKELDARILYEKQTGRWYKK